MVLKDLKCVHELTIYECVVEYCIFIENAVILLALFLNAGLRLLFCNSIKLKDA